MQEQIQSVYNEFLDINENSKKQNDSYKAQLSQHKDNIEYLIRNSENNANLEKKLDLLQK